MAKKHTIKRNSKAHRNRISCRSVMSTSYDELHGDSLDRGLKNVADKLNSAFNTSLTLRHDSLLLQGIADLLDLDFDENGAILASSTSERARRVYAFNRTGEDNLSYLDDLEFSEQKRSSRKTAVNAKQGKLPAIYKKINFPNNSIVLDYGGGEMRAEQLADEYLSQFRSECVVYDPYNLSPQENAESLKYLKANGLADIAICSNVLNVIEEDGARRTVLRNIAKYSKKGASIYIQVYEGTSAQQQSGPKPVNDDQYQRFTKLSGYLEEVQEVFPDAKIYRGMIVATNN